MSTVQWLAVLIPGAYLIGSIPFGLLVGLSRGVDPRRAGSGNIGATNVGRLLGARYFAIVFLLDLLKGLIPMLMAGWVLKDHSRGALGFWLWLSVGLAAITGHMFSLFLAFRGGKGVATSLGVVLGVWPFYTLAGLAVGAVWGLIFWRTRIVSVASIVATGLFPVAYVLIGLAMGWDIFGDAWPLLAFAVFVSGLVIWKHRGNISRLRAGTENRFSRQGPSASGAERSSLHLP
ncbi:MAG: glycerol-3-phosphate 1-O-acyltransferase PlsY [Phycisphaerae bacterium]|nr:glycerol-3-phosphate 1-O-acyltransferase PlsY [Phycisphaerae bacterium]MDW8262612.1 glycerol-3-phosphate 1-O-acyltransferase PlsY [Phycisphaerales bacterium]